ncbi:MAG: hypothetical protein ACXQS4_03855 [Methermicoccaceae archaeon]
MSKARTCTFSLTEKEHTIIDNIRYRGTIPTPRSAVIRHAIHELAKAEGIEI